MSERYRYTVSVTHEVEVWADDAHEAAQYALEDLDVRGGWPAVYVEAVRDSRKDDAT